MECRQSTVTAENDITDTIGASRVALLATDLSPNLTVEESERTEKDDNKPPSGTLLLLLSTPTDIVSNLLPSSTVHDYLQLPDWLLKFLPSSDAVFVQDDVLLLMRQHSPTQKALDSLEDKSLIPSIVDLYGREEASE